MLYDKIRVQPKGLGQQLSGGTQHEDPGCSTSAQWTLSRKGIYTEGMEDPKITKIFHTPNCLMVYTSPSKVARAFELKRLRVPIPSIAHRLGVHRTTVTRILKDKNREADPYYKAPKPGRPSKLDERDVRIVARALAGTQVLNATEAAKTLLPNVSRHTVARHLKAYGFVCRVRRGRFYISRPNVGKRRGWGKDHENWTQEEWDRVIFSDESKFLLFKSDGLQYCWRRPSEAFDPRFTKKHIKHGAGNIMVWGCVTSKGMGRLIRIDGKMDGPAYVEILKEGLLGTLKDHRMKCTGKYGYIFQQDNDPKHTSRVASEFLAKKKIKKLPWPPSSPDMSIIEHVWDQIDRRVRARDHLPTNKEQLWEALQEEWVNFPMESLRTLYESMPHRIEALLKAKGQATKY